MSEWIPSRWWRVTYAGGVWCETQDEAEARRRMWEVPGGWDAARLERLYEKIEHEWQETL